MPFRTLSPIAAKIAVRVCLASAIATTASPGASANNAPPTLTQIEECMLKVLKVTPGVEIVASHVPPIPMRNRTPYPFLEYRFLEHAILFDVEKYEGDHDSYTFYAAIPTGLAPIGSHAPVDDWGTVNLEKKWKAQCDAAAFTVTE